MRCWREPDWPAFVPTTWWASGAVFALSYKDTDTKAYVKLEQGLRSYHRQSPERTWDTAQSNAGTLHKSGDCTWNWLLVPVGMRESCGDSFALNRPFIGSTIPLNPQGCQYPSPKRALPMTNSSICFHILWWLPVQQEEKSRCPSPFFWLRLRRVASHRHAENSGYPGI